MRVAQAARELRQDSRPVCAAIGVFDGLHLGHREILRRIRDKAASSGGESLVITFDQHPNAVVAPDRVPPIISPLRQRLRLMENLGMDAALVLPFDVSLSRVGGEDFIRGLAADLGSLRSLTVGEEFTFGHKRSGNVELLKRLGRELGFTVDPVGGVELHGQRVSSTRIRELIQSADFAAAEQLLGRRWALVGNVVTGDQLGRQIGFPTANLETNGLVLPPHGVYAGRVLVNGASWKVALNIGVRPTVSQPVPQLRVEAHLIDFAGELVGQELEIEILGRLRSEMKFPSFEALRAQIAADVAAVRCLP